MKTPENCSTCPAGMPHCDHTELGGRREDFAGRYYLPGPDCPYHMIDQLRDAVERLQKELYKASTALNTITRLKPDYTNPEAYYRKVQEQCVAYSEQPVQGKVEPVRIGSVWENKDTKRRYEVNMGDSTSGESIFRLRCVGELTEVYLTEKRLRKWFVPFNSNQEEE